MRALRITELRRFARNRMTAAALVVAMVIPLLYGALYLWAFWNPTSHLDQIPVALVQQDRGARDADGKSVNAGRELGDKLTKANTLDWQPTDAADARQGLEAGRYYAVLTIPANFSSAVLSVSGEKPTSAPLKVEYDDANGYTARTILTSVMGQVRTATSETLGASMVEKVLVGYGDVHAGLVKATDGAQDLADGADKADTGAGRLADGSARLATGADQLARGLTSADSGASRLAEGAESASTGARRLADGADQLSTGITTLAQGIPQAVTGAHALADGATTVSTGATALSSGASRLAAGLPAAQDAAGQLAAGAAKVAQGGTASAAGAATLADKAATLATGAGALAAKLDAAPTAATRLARGAAEVADGSTRVASGAESTAQGADALSAALTQAARADASLAPLADKAAALAAGAQSVSRGANNVATGAQSVADGGGALADGLGAAVPAAEQIGGGATALAAGARTLSTGVGALSTGATKVSSGAAALHDGVTDAVKGSQTLAQGGTSLAAGASKLATGATTLADKLDQAGQGASALRDGAGQLAAGTNELAAKLPELASGATTLADGLADARIGSTTLATSAHSLTEGATTLADGTTKLATGSSELAAKLAQATADVPTWSADEATSTAGVMSSPVSLDAEFLHKASSNGEGFAPYFIALALYVGALILWMILRPLSQRSLAAPVSATRVVASNLLPALIIGTAQVILLVTVLVAGLGLSPTHLVAFAGFALLVSTAFIALQQAIYIWLGTSVGRLVVLILLMLQLTSAGGTYPASTTPEFFQKLHQVLPMTHVVDGFRACITGDLGGEFTAATSYLVILIGGAFVVAVVGAARGRVFTMSRLHPAVSL